MSVKQIEEHKVFKGLADPNRILLLDIISKGEECNCNLGDKINMPLSTLAHHLKVLVEANLVVPRKEGKWTYYTLNKEQFELAVQGLARFTSK